MAEFLKPEKMISDFIVYGLKKPISIGNSERFRKFAPIQNGLFLFKNTMEMDSIFSSELEWLIWIFCINSILFK